MSKTKQSFSVPNSFFDKIVERLVTAHASEILSYAAYESDTNLDAEQQQVHSETDEAEYGHLVECLIALVRIHHNDYSSSSQEIENSDDYLNVWKAAVQLSEKIAYSTLPEGNLKNLVDTMYERGIR